jgi:hypothetical protein
MSELFKSLAKGLVISAAGAAVAYLTPHISPADGSTEAILKAFLASNLVNFLNQKLINKK